MKHFLLMIVVVVGQSVLADHIIVVDVTTSMKHRMIGRHKIQKLKVVQHMLLAYLEAIPANGSRVYISYFGGNKKLATEFIFDAKGKKGAIEQAKEYDKAHFGPSTNLWGSFHKALNFTEKNGYYKPADPKVGAREKLPSIILFSDGGDDQKGNNAWVFYPPLNNPNIKQAIRNAHPWLPLQKVAVGQQLKKNLHVIWPPRR